MNEPTPEQSRKVYGQLVAIFNHRKTLEALSDGELIDLGFHLGCQINWRDGELIEELLDRFQKAIKLDITPEGRTTDEIPYPDEENNPLDAEVIE